MGNEFGLSEVLEQPSVSTKQKPARTKSESERQARPDIRSRMSEYAFAKNVPLAALVVLTDRCHLRCQQCYLVEHPRPEMTTEEVKDTLEQLSELGSTFLTLSGGEPLLRTDIYDLIRHARKLGLLTSIFTTATSCNPERSRRLAEAGLNWASISLYAAEPEIHDEVTQIPGSFAKTIEGVKNLQREGISVQLKFLQMTTNSDQLTPTRALAAELGASFLVTLDLIMCHDGRQDPLQYQLHEEAMYEVYLHLAQTDPDGLGKIQPSPNNAKHKPCAAGRSRIAIGTDGSVYPCLEWLHEMGNVREQSLADIWNNHTAQSLRESVRYSSLACQVCPDKAFCYYCPGAALLENSDPGKPSVNTCMTARVRRRVYENVFASPLQEHEGNVSFLAQQKMKMLAKESSSCSACSGGQAEKALSYWLEQPSRFAPASNPKPIEIPSK